MSNPSKYQITLYLVSQLKKYFCLKIIFNTKRRAGATLKIKESILVKKEKKTSSPKSLLNLKVVQRCLLCFHCFEEIFERQDFSPTCQ